jgi:DNA repair photolyase
MEKVHRPHKGRGAVSNPDNRFAQTTTERIDDGWGSLEEHENPLRELVKDSARSIISRNNSPDIPLRQSINPYRGCEHGCVYCFARPNHAYLGYSPGLDFESKLHYKPNAAELLRKELAARNYQCQPIALGINTDAYQPIERQLGITRDILQVLVETRHPVNIITKSALIERDIDLLQDLAAANLINVMVSITTLDKALARTLEPRAAAPHRRIKLIENLSQAGIPVGVMMAPLIPFLTDHEMQGLLTQAHQAGALRTGYILLRLPREVEGLFTDWLEAHVPDKAQRVMQRMRDCHGGKAYQAEFGSRMLGKGVFAELLAKRFQQAVKQLGFPGLPALDCGQFRPPATNAAQLEMFS